MNSKKILVAGMLISGMLLSSCKRDETIIPLKTENVQISKTNEMLNFEKQLSIWIAAKSEKKDDKAVIQQTEEVAKKLLVSIGKPEIANQSVTDINVFVRTTLQEYSIKLTEMRNQTYKTKIVNN